MRRRDRTVATHPSQARHYFRPPWSVATRSGLGGVHCLCAAGSLSGVLWAEAGAWWQVVFAIAGTLLAAVLVATMGDTSAHKALLAARHSQEQQMAGSWAADHKGMMRLAAIHQLAIKKASLATKAPGDQSSDDDESGDGDVKESVANKLFGAEAGSGGNAAAPPYEVEEDSDVGLSPS